MKTIWKQITMALMSLLLIYTLTACDSSDAEQIDVTVMLIDTSYKTFEPEREFSSDEAVFVIKNVPEEEVRTDGDYRYIISTNEKYAAIIEYTGKSKTIKFPSKVNDIPVVCITVLDAYYYENNAHNSPLCSDNQVIEKVVLPNTIIAIGPRTFEGFKNLKSISFPASLTHIYEYAFSGCSSIRTLEFPESLKSIGHRTFYECTSLETIAISDGFENIGTWSFEECTNLREVTLPKSLIYVSEGAFSKCEKLDTIHLSHNTILHENFYKDSSRDTDSTIPELVYYDEEKQSDTDIFVVPEITKPKYVEDLEGYTLRIFDVGSVDNNYYSMFNDDNFKKVIETVSKLYNCSIIEVTSDDYYNDLKNAAMLGESFCDIAIIPSDIVLELAFKNVIIPWQPTQSVDFAADWWDQSANNRYNLNGVQIAVSGDFNINNFASQICYVYNRDKLDKFPYEKGQEKYTYSSMLIHDAASGDFGKNGDFGVEYANDTEVNWEYYTNYYTHDGGICGSTFDYYRTMLAGQGIDFYNFSEDSSLSLSYETGYGYINRMEGMSKDSERSKYISDMKSGWVPIREAALKNLELRLMNESIGSIDMSSFKACDESLFTNGTSTFKIARLDEVPTLMETGIDIGIVTLPGGIYTSLVDTPTLAVQPICAVDEHKNLVILDAIAEYSSKEMLPDIMESFIGVKPENDDKSSTYSYNEKMFKKICEKPYYEFDIGSTGDTIQYLYYKYMLRYVTSDSGNSGISNQKFESALWPSMQKLNRISNAIESYIEAFPVTEPVAPVTKETWADEYSNLYSNIHNLCILSDVFDISKITSLFNRNEDGYCSSDAAVLGSILSAYSIFTNTEPVDYDHYADYESFYLKSDLSRDENAIIERFFYTTGIYKYPLSYVQEALDYFYGDGMFNVEPLSNKTWCYITDDNQYLYLQDNYGTSGLAYYRLVDIEYIDDSAIIYMNVINSYYNDRYTFFNDYANHTVLAKNEGSVEYAGNSIFDRFKSEGITFDEMGIVKLFLTKDSTGIHVKGISTELTE